VLFGQQIAPCSNLATFDFTILTTHSLRKKWIFYHGSICTNFHSLDSGYVEDSSKLRYRNQLDFRYFGNLDAKVTLGSCL